MPSGKLKKILLYSALSIPLYFSSPFSNNAVNTISNNTLNSISNNSLNLVSNAYAGEEVIAMGTHDKKEAEEIKNIKHPTVESIIQKKGPCSSFLEDKIIEFKDFDVQSKLESFTDYTDGEPVIHILARFFQDVSRKNTEGMCYFVKGSTMKNALTHKYTGNRKEVKDGLEEIFTRLPINEMNYLQAEVINGQVEIRGVYNKAINDGVLTIPQKFHMTLEISKVHDGKYHVKFRQDDNLPKVEIWTWVRWLLGINLDGMDVSKTDSSSNRKEIYGLINALDERNKIKIGKK